MTKLENLKRLLADNSNSWIPFTLNIGSEEGLTEPIKKKLKKYTGNIEPDEYFDYDFRSFSLKARFGGETPEKYHSDIKEGTYFDEWGVGHWSGGAEGTIDLMYHPLKNAESIKEVEEYPEPVIEPPENLIIIDEYHRRGYPVFGYSGSIYEWSWWLRGMTNFLMDLITNPSLAEAIIEKVAGYTLKLALKSAEYGLDVLCFYDDAGMQTGLQISPELWRKLIKPRWKSILEKTKSKYPEVHFFLHSCGNIYEIIPDIIEAGFDILHPIQPECMDIEKVKKEFGKYIVLSASISSQKTFPFGTPDEIRKEIRRLVDLFSDSSGCILCPSNAIQPETPIQNILAFVDEAKRLRQIN